MSIDEINIKPLEKVTDNTAKQTTECCYPDCELCSRYVAFGSDRYCTVPIVVSKQMWMTLENVLEHHTNKLDSLSYEIRCIWGELTKEDKTP